MWREEERRKAEAHELPGPDRRKGRKPFPQHETELRALGVESKVRLPLKLGMVPHAYNTSTMRAKAGGLP